MQRTAEAATAALIVWLLAIALGDWLDAPSLAGWALLTTASLGLLALTEGAARFGGGVLRYGWPVYLILFGGVVIGSSLDARISLAGAVVFAVGSVIVAIKTFKAVKTWVPADEPLAKGDGACFKQIVFAHRFLALGGLFTVATFGLATADSLWHPRFLLASLHILLIGHVLLSTYAVTHLWIPRFSGVPATAAGAIKGELHTTLLGLSGLVLGFLLQSRGLIAGLGFFVFVGFFTYMGVLGANMMKNKSKTQRVTPEFIYIPFVFTAIFWLICAVLMGLFLNAVPNELAPRLPALQHAHWNAALVGGVLQMFMGLATRMVEAPLRFQGALRLSFFAFNGGVALWLYSAFDPATLPWAVGLLALGLVAFIVPFTRLMSRSAPVRA